jgi:hypothetical protein
VLLGDVAGWTALDDGLDLRFLVEVLDIFIRIDGQQLLHCY